jgi:hypothetical protein
MSDDSVGDGHTLPSWSRITAYDQGSVDEPRAGGVSRLRPYVMTSGQVTPVDDTLEIEAQILTTDLGITFQAGVAFERRDILALCSTPMSVAEVASKLSLHIGVTRVLVAELAAVGYLSIQRPGPRLFEDVSLIERVIRGLESIH